MRIEEKCYMIVTKVNNEDVYLTDGVHCYELAEHIGGAVKCANATTADVLRRAYFEERYWRGERDISLDSIHDFDTVPDKIKNFNIVPVMITYEY